jgi:DNA repair protein RecN (Recombination protein N)
LPQVAAKGKKHFVVYKNIENHATKTFVKEVRAQDRILEIAQMLGGENPGPRCCRQQKNYLINRT